MPTVHINWQQLKGRQLETTTGAFFTVVRVTATHVTIRPQRGSRNYALSIPDELEHGIAVYVGKPVFPAPAELGLIGVRPILASYAWGILKAVLVDGIGLQTFHKAKLKDFAGHWQLVDMPEMDDEYLEDEPDEPSIQIHVSAPNSYLRGEYQIGLSVGSLEGELREFGGEQVIIFGYEGTDEMDPVSGGGWLRLVDSATLEGEFVGDLGRFTANRGKEKRVSAKRSRQGVKSLRHIKITK